MVCLGLGVFINWVVSWSRRVDKQVLRSENMTHFEKNTAKKEKYPTFVATTDMSSGLDKDNKVEFVSKIVFMMDCYEISTIEFS